MKTYIVDTNVFMKNAYALYILSGNEIPDEDANKQFLESLEERLKHIDNENEREEKLRDYYKPNNVVIPNIVIRELGNLKDDKDVDISRAARKAINVLDDFLDEYQEEKLSDSENPEVIPNWEKYGDCHREIELSNGAKIIFQEHSEEDFLKTNIPNPKDDDRILFQTFQFVRNNPSKNKILISLDKELRVQSRLKGIRTEEFEYETIKDLNQLPLGYIKCNIPVAWLDFVKSNQQISSTRPQISNLLSTSLVNNQIVAFYQEGTNLLKHYYRTSIGENEITLLPVTSKEKLIEFYESSTFLTQKKEKRKCHIEASMSFEYVKKELFHEYESLPEEIQNSSEASSLRNKINNMNKNKFNQEYINKLFNQIQSLRENQSKKHNSTGSKMLELCKGLRFNPDLMPHLIQKPYLDLLLDPEVQIITANGPGGTGKTLFAFLGGIIQLLANRYESIRYTKPLITADEGVGYLPGELKEKMEPYKIPAVKSLRTIFGYRGASIDYKETIDKKILLFENEGQIEYESISFDAGDTWTDRYVIIDESQLFTKDQMRLLIGRVGEGSKIILLGDLEQISTSVGRKYSYITERNSGLAHVIEKLKGERAYGHITLPDDNVLRGYVARIANKI